MSQHGIRHMRKEYGAKTLDEKQVEKDPFLQFEKWFAEAVGFGIDEPNAMFLATAGSDGHPSGRIVLLKEITAGGLVFFTNYTSRKGMQISENPDAAVVFFWHKMERQVRIEGKVEKITQEQSDDYFYSRPSESRKAAAVSPQSQVIPDRQYLEEKFNSAENEPQRPVNWGGYRIIPELFEFWQGREYRLHDRIRYRFDGNVWIIERLAP